MDSIKRQATQTTHQYEPINGVASLQEVGISQGLPVTPTGVSSKVNTHQAPSLSNTQSQPCKIMQPIKAKKPFESLYSAKALKKEQAEHRNADAFKDFDKIFHHRATQKLNQMLEDKIFCIEGFAGSKKFISRENQVILGKIADNLISSEHIKIEISFYDSMLGGNSFTVNLKMISKDRKVKIKHSLSYYEEDINPWKKKSSLPIKDKEHFITTCFVNLCKDMSLDLWVSGFKLNFPNTANKTSMAYINSWSYWDATIGVDVIDEQNTREITLAEGVGNTVQKGYGRILMPIVEFINLENNSVNLQALRERLGKKRFEDLFSDIKAPNSTIADDMSDHSDSDSDSDFDSDSDSDSDFNFGDKKKREWEGGDGFKSGRPVVASVAKISDDACEFKKIDDQYNMAEYSIV